VKIAAGGGGGLYGGGAGGSQFVEEHHKKLKAGNGGGGGGSNLVPAGGKANLAKAKEPASVVITYSVTIPPTPPSVVAPSGLPVGQQSSVSAPSAPPLSAPSAPPLSLTGLSQSHRRWRPGKNLARFAAASKPPVGTTFQFTLNEAATVRFAFAKLVPGRQVNGQCVAQTKRNRRHKACKRSVPSGSLSFSAGAGLHKLSFQGRLTRTAKLKPGTYTVTITATNTAGQRATNTLSFAIVPG
jgi:hypothetical protein